MQPCACNWYWRATGLWLRRGVQIGTFTLFQETYHRDTFRKMHVSGPKSDYNHRLLTQDRAMRAGLDDVGIGTLFGLFDYRFEVLAMLQHSEHLEKEYGAGPHTISVPRMRPADGSELSSAPPHVVRRRIYDTWFSPNVRCRPPVRAPVPSSPSNHIHPTIMSLWPYPRYPSLVLRLCDMDLKARSAWPLRVLLFATRHLSDAGGSECVMRPWGGLHPSAGPLSHPSGARVASQWSLCCIPVEPLLHISGALVASQWSPCCPRPSSSLTYIQM